MLSGAIEADTVGILLSEAEKATLELVEIRRMAQTHSTKQAKCVSVSDVDRASNSFATV